MTDHAEEPEPYVIHFRDEPTSSLVANEASQEFVVEYDDVDPMTASKDTIEDEDLLQVGTCAADCPGSDVVTLYGRNLIGQRSTTKYCGNCKHLLAKSDVQASQPLSASDKEELAKLERRVAALQAYFREQSTEATPYEIDFSQDAAEPLTASVGGNSSGGGKAYEIVFVDEAA